MTGGEHQTSQKTVLAAPVCSARRYFFYETSEFQSNTPKRPKNLLSQTRAIPLLSLGKSHPTHAQPMHDGAIFIDESLALFTPNGENQ